MQFVGIAFFVLGYGAVYTGVQMIRRPAGGSSGSYLYWVTGIDSLGAPSGGSGKGKQSGNANNKPTGKNNDVKKVRLIK